MRRSGPSGSNDAPDIAGSPGGREFWVPLLAAAAGLVVYVQTLPYGLVWDDPVLVAQTRSTVESHGILGLWLSPFLRDPVTGVSLGYYRPIVSLVVWLTSRLADFSPWAYHAVAVVVHALNCALVGRLLQRLLNSPRAALFGALVFAAHPAHTESVTFFSGLTDVLATTFVLCAGLFLLRAVSSTTSGRRWHSAMYAMAFFFGCLSKEMVLLLPPVLGLWWLTTPAAERCRLAEAWRRHRFLIIASMAVPALALGLRFFAGGVPFLPGAPAQTESVGWSSIPALWSIYFRLLVVPWPLNALYGREQIAWTPVAAFCTLLLLGACGAYATERHRRVGVRALTWIVVFLAPVSGLIPLTSAPIADRFLYLPSVGFCFLCGYIFEYGTGFPRARPTLLVLSAAIVIIGAWGTVSRNRVWKDEVSLFADVTRTTPASPFGHNNYGDALMDAGRTREAYEAFLKAVRLKPDFTRATYNAGLAAEALDDFERAESFFRRAIELKPAWAAPYIELGELFGRRRRWGEAEGLLLKAAQAEPRNALAHKDLGLARLMQGDRAAALEEYRLLSVLDPAMARDLQSWIDRVP